MKNAATLLNSIKISNKCENPDFLKTINYTLSTIKKKLANKVRLRFLTAIYISVKINSASFHYIRDTWKLHVETQFPRMKSLNTP